MKIGGGTTRHNWTAAAVILPLLVAGCAPRPVAPASASPPVAAVAASAPPTAPPPVPPGLAELKQELAIVSSPQVSRERSLSEPGRVQDMGGAWVRFGPMRVGSVNPLLQKTGKPDVPFKAQLVVTHAQSYSGICPTRSEAARAPLPYTEERTTTYRYDYQATGTWSFQGQKDGPLIDKGRH